LPNLLEHYIKEIKSIEEVPHEDWMNQKYLNVTLVANCYGDEREYKRWFGAEEWEKVKEQGHFMS
jgi:hypothetical protein